MITHADITMMPLPAAYFRFDAATPDYYAISPPCLFDIIILLRAAIFRRCYRRDVIYYDTRQIICRHVYALLFYKRARCLMLCAIAMMLFSLFILQLAHVFSATMLPRLRHAITERLRHGHMLYAAAATLATLPLRCFDAAVTAPPYASPYAAAAIHDAVTC